MTTSEVSKMTKSHASSFSIPGLTRLRQFILGAFAISTVGMATPANAQCAPAWSNGFGLPGMDNTVYSLFTFDDGGGPALYAGGEFTQAGGTTTQGLTK